MLLTLFITTTNGSLVLYSILQAYNMFDINVTGFTLLTVSITYATTVGNDDACESEKVALYCCVQYN